MHNGLGDPPPTKRKLAISQMSNIPIKKPLISLIFLLLICLSMLFGTAANGSETDTTYCGEFRASFAHWYLGLVRTSWSVSPNNGSVRLEHPQKTDAWGWARFKLHFLANACGTYTVTMWVPNLPTIYQDQIVYSEPCPTGSSSGTSSSSSGTSSSSSETTSPPPSPQLIKLSDANQVTHPEDSVVLSVQLRDPDGSPMSDAELTFFLLSGDTSRASLSPVRATTDANGRAQTTLTFNPDATGVYIVEAYRSDEFGLYTQFTVTVDPLLPKATRLNKISGDDQTGLTGGVWAAPFVVEVLDQYDAPLEGVPVTFTIVTGGGILSAETTRTNANGLATSTLRLGADAVTNTVEVSVEGISETVTFTAEVLPPTLTSISGDNQSAAAGTVLANPFVVEVRDGNGAPLAGVAVTFVVRAGGGTVSHPTATTGTNGQAASTLRLGTEPGPNTVEVSAEGITDIVTFRAVAELLEFDLSLSAGISLIHVPLKVQTVDGQTQTIESVSDLYTALGGAETVNWLMTYDAETQNWRSYWGDADRGAVTDKTLTDDTGIIANIKNSVSVRLGGNALGTDGSSTLTLNRGLNLVGLPLRDSRVARVSDLFSLDGIGGNVSTVIITDNGEFKTVSRVGDPRDIAITGGQSFILTAQQAATISISGEGWHNPLGTTAASPMAITGIKVGEIAPILALSGSIIDGGMGLKMEGFDVTVKNLLTGRAVAAMTPSDEIGYRATVVDMETGHAATVGDVLEISAESPNPFMGVKPLRYTVTVEDIKRHRIQLPPLVAYEIPAETELLRNYPNPFNPETWIPYRLAEEADVSLTIYDVNGALVRAIDVGHQNAAVYESRAKAIYWDGRNRFGEQVASGIYFYSLSTGDFSATRKMVILK